MGEGKGQGWHHSAEGDTSMAANWEQRHECTGTRALGMGWDAF